MTDQNTRAQPSAEPVAWMYERGNLIAASRTRLHCGPDETETPLYPASALEAARREDQDRIAELEACIDLVIPDDCKSQLHEDATNMLKLQTRIAALEADNARLMGLVEEAGEGFSGPTAWLERWATHVGNCHGGALCECGLTLASLESATTLAKIKENSRVTD